MGFSDPKSHKDQSKCPRAKGVEGSELNRDSLREVSQLSVEVGTGLGRIGELTVGVTLQRGPANGNVNLNRELHPPAPGTTSSSAIPR
jgi:hypothetical protein